MRTTILLLLPLFAAGSAKPQAGTISPEPPGLEDPAVRKEAVRLLERANTVSIPARWLTHDHVVHFKVSAPAPGEAAEGDIRSSVGTSRQFRTEVTYGDFRLVDVLSNHQRGWLAAPGTTPPIIDRVRRITPIYLVRFDNEDIIRRVSDAQVNGRSARCVDFVTKAGEERQENRICVDAASGVMVLFQVGRTALVYSDFFECSGGLFPAHIVRTVNGVEEFSIDQKMSIVQEFPAGTFDFPPGAKMGPNCRQYRRPFAIETPQPTPGSSPDVIDVVLRGYIGADGHVVQVSPFESSRPDLNEQALRLVSTWTYEPAQCDGSAVPWFNLFHVKFKGY